MYALLIIQNHEPFYIRFMIAYGGAVAVDEGHAREGEARIPSLHVLLVTFVPLEGLMLI
jgi:hypothetical protein